MLRVVAGVPDSPDTFDDAVDYLMRFVRVRRPSAFVLLGSMDEALKAAMDSATEPYGYEVNQSRKDGVEFIGGIAELDFEDIAWEVLQEVVRRIGEGAEGIC